METSKIEFYKKGTYEILGKVDSCMVPPVGSLISIFKKAWKVFSITYAIDHPTDYFERIRANVDLEPYGIHAKEE
jgi:hypothetical protein